MPVDFAPYRFFKSLPYHQQGWGGDDPEQIVLEFLADQHLAVRNIVGRSCDADTAAIVWADRLRKQSVILRDESERMRVLAFTSKLPERLASRMPPESAGFAVCMRRINSGRPFVTEWIVPFGLTRPITTFAGDVELYPPEVSVVLGLKWPTAFGGSA